MVDTAKNIEIKEFQIISTISEEPTSSFCFVEFKAERKKKKHTMVSLLAITQTVRFSQWQGLLFRKSEENNLKEFKSTRNYY